jgi:arylsulfatase A-like enzyme
MLVAVSEVTAAPPNVLLVLTDDQGYGDLGWHGNPIVQTPVLDKFARSSIQLRNFYVSPVCTPTRASLMTGRYHHRTGAVDTYLGRAMMFADEVTLAERLREHGYRTGLFGKWHLGDCYPYRPQDQGFQEVLMHRGGGIGQPSDPPGGSSYFDPILFHNGQAENRRGYITDVITDAALEFITRPSQAPFFAYVAYNCPHSPYQVPEADWRPYRQRDLGPVAFPRIGHPWASPKLNQEEIARAYGMITNIDRNFGRLLAQIPRNTLVIFLTDNGPGGVRWNAGLRDRKGSVYEGGIRVPCFIRWEGRLAAAGGVETPAAHIDIMPTILEACGLPLPQQPALDGRSLLPLLQGKLVDWSPRYLFFQWHRGDTPEQDRAFAVRGPRFKLVQPVGVAEGKPYKPRFELYDLHKDPLEEHDLAAQQPELVRELHRRHQEWFADVMSTRRRMRPRIYLGHPAEPVTVLTRQDWRGPQAGWKLDSVGHWEVTVSRAGRYRLTLLMSPSPQPRTVVVRLGSIEVRQRCARGLDQLELELAQVPVGEGELHAILEEEGGKRIGVHQIVVTRIGD